MERIQHNYIFDTVKGIKDTQEGRTETFYPVNNEGKPFIYLEKSQEIYYTEHGDVVSPTDSYVGKILDVSAK